MPITELLHDRLGCPRCDGALTELSCPACQVDFPLHNEVPWLVADPDACRLEWKNRWQMALKDLEQRQRNTRDALAATVSNATRARLQVLTDGYATQHRALKHLLKDLGLAAGADLETYLALKTRLPSQMGLMAYEANVFRDWVWGEAENAAALNAVVQALSDQPENLQPQSMLVLGAGAGRLAYDLHQAEGRPASPLTVALELNPYLTAVTARLSAGHSLELVEFPLAPRSGAQSAITRTLKAPAPARPGFQVVLADALRPPFLPGSFDCVVTPWLLDVIDADLSTILALVNRLLAPGGYWIYHGSLAFQQADPAANVNLEELEELADAAGLSVTAVGEETVPYLDCPDSRHGRRESVLTLAARKREDVKVPARQQNLPDWIARGREPVPALPAFQSQALATRIHAFIMSLIDGKRSLKDMAEVMEAQQLMSKEEAETAIRGFLIKMFDEARSGQGL